MNKKLVLLLLLLITSKLSAQSVAVKNLIFEGGGVRGLAYAGALLELEQRNMLDSVDRVAGTSAGAIAATLYAIGYTPQEILHLIYDLRIKSFADGRWIFIGGTRRLIRNFGWYRGEKFYKWISVLIKKKTGKEDLTFEELHRLSINNPTFKQLYLTGTNLSKQRAEVLCQETYPRMEVRTGVRISMSIPFFFQAVLIDEYGIVCSQSNSTQSEVMVDGGIVANYPIHIFDYSKYVYPEGDSTAMVNPGTLGLRLDSDKQIECDQRGEGLSPMEIRKMKDFTQAFYNIILENLNRQNLTSDDWKRTISISTGGISPRIKRLPAKDKNTLIENGRKGTASYFSRF